MIHKSFQTIILILGLSIAAGAYSGNFSGNQLYDACKSKKSFGKRGLCIGYIAGVIQGVRKWQAQKLKICMPRKELSRRKMRKVVIRYYDRNKVEHNITAVKLVLRALKRKYACPK